MNIPKFEHGTFCVLIVSTVHPSILYAEAGLEASIPIEGKRTAIAASLIRKYDGQLVPGYGSPLTALWPCEKDSPDRRALAAALAITGALANPETIPPTDPVSPHWALTIGAACELTFFQRCRKDIINVLGPAVTRADHLHDLAKERGITLAIDARLASLPSPVRWVRVTDEAWRAP